MDTELVARAQRGDQAAFAEIASGSYGRMNSLAYGILRGRSLAEDATQQAMLEAWRSLPKLRDPARFQAWVYRLTVNACYAEARRAKRWMPNIAIDDSREPRARDEISPIADRDLLDRGFRELPVDQRAVLVLRHVVGLSLEEVARTLDIPAGTARSRLYRALQSMRASIDADTRPPNGGSAAVNEIQAGQGMP
jgi:RNA polymerase sigma-70 factor (ECF subfamily)